MIALIGRPNSVFALGLGNLLLILTIRLSAPLTERPGIRKSRVGGWRILFSMDREAQVLYILTVDTRGQVYKHS